MKNEQFSILFYLSLLLVWSSFLFFFGLGDLEFFRHTEADRTLIALEMLETGEFVVPHLLGVPILTKPPLFYWLSAFFIEISGQNTEFAARAVSAFFSVIFVLFFFAVHRRTGFTTRASALAAAALATCFTFLNLATLAEIDLLFGLFCFVALYFCFLSILRESFGFTLVSYLFAALAFLTKGPPIIIFFAVSSLLFLLVLRHSGELRLQGHVPPKIIPYIARNLVGVLIFLAVVSLWIVPLANSVGWEELGRQLQVEVIDRVVDSSEDNKNRGPLFYVFTALGSLMPWSFAALYCLLLSKIGSNSSTENKFNLSLDKRAFLYFNCIVSVSGIVLLSMAAGKSNRYLFPLVPSLLHIFFVILCVFGRRAVASEFHKPLLAILSLVSLALVILPAVYLPQGVLYSTLLFACSVFASCGFFLIISLYRQSVMQVVIAMLALVTAFRFAQVEVFVPHRNTTRTAKPVVKTILASIPQGETLYTFEMFERWIVYYLEREGLEVVQLTPEILEAMPEQALHLLLSGKDETCDLEVMAANADHFEHLETIKTNKQFVYLARATRTNALITLRDFCEDEH